MKDEDICTECNVWLEMIEPTPEHPRLFECPVCRARYTDVTVLGELDLELN